MSADPTNSERQRRYRSRMTWAAILPPRPRRRNSARSATLVAERLARPLATAKERSPSGTPAVARPGPSLTACSATREAEQSDTGAGDEADRRRDAGARRRIMRAARDRRDLVLR
jgi:hypothetical protein